MALDRISLNSNLDTNALLVPFTIGKSSLEQIHKTYKVLVAQKRLFIPGQVAREFAKNRASKIAELFQQLNRKKGINPLQKGQYPLLEGIPDYQETIRLEDEIDKLIVEYKKAITKVLEHIQAWTWNDPVSRVYAEILADECVFDPVLDKNKTLEELRARYKHRIPPGYKDGGKEDEGIGDLIIWKTILELGKAKKKSVLLVSGEEKADWRLKSEGQPLYPRYELIDEFRRQSEGQSFHIAQFSSFLDLYGASAEAVQEVREKEQETAAAVRVPDTLRQVLEVGNEVIYSHKEYPEAVRIVADKLGIRPQTVADKCTRRIGLDTAEFRRLLQNKAELINYLVDWFPEHVDVIQRELR